MSSQMHVFDMDISEWTYRNGHIDLPQLFYIKKDISICPVKFIFSNGHIVMDIPEWTYRLGHIIFGTYLHIPNLFRYVQFRYVHFVAIINMDISENGHIGIPISESIYPFYSIKLICPFSDIPPFLPAPHLSKHQKYIQK